MPLLCHCFSIWGLDQNKASSEFISPTDLTKR
nr:MAG TPA: hypothetical protein [Siphoviridae sp. ctX8T1]